MSTVSLEPTCRPSPRSPHIFKRHDEFLDDPNRVGPVDGLSVEEILMLAHILPAWRDEQPSQRRDRLTGARMVLEWLMTHPGDGWQQRWRTSGADDGTGWINVLVASDIWADDTRTAATKREVLARGLRFLLICQVVLPSYTFLTAYHATGLFSMVRAVRRPDLFVKIEENAAALGITRNRCQEGLSIVTKLVLHTGRDVDQLTAEDVFVYRTWISHAHPHSGHARPDLAWELLRGVTDLGEHATLRSALRLGQRTTTEMVDAYELRCRPIRNVLLRYLSERRPALDYNSFKNVATNLVGNFWADIETHHPGIDSLHLPDEVAEAWKQRVRIVIDKDGSTRPRRSYLELLMQVRAFYLDVQEWAVEDVSWAPWAVPSPVRKGETVGLMKAKKARSAVMHQRVRDRMPHLHILVDTIEQHRADQAALLGAARAVEIGQTFAHNGREFRRTAPKSRGEDTPATVHVTDFVTGEMTDLTRSEDEAFWSWAVIETLRHTGVRVEELTEITHCALVQYTMPKTNELVPMLQIVPSKGNAERLLMISPELTSVLATIISRLRNQNDGTVPLTARYDPYERICGDPLPHLFQRRYEGWRWDVLSYNTVQKLLGQALVRTGLRDATGVPLRYTPHDFRRIFATEAVTGGLPVHIVARLLGHADINTTQAYMAVFDEELIKSYRAFLQKRRATRPTAEYREPTDDEWREFQQHFETRKLALGECGRPYGTDCKHEHACVRCPSLRVDPNERPRLVAIIENLKDRIQEARLNGWTGEVKGLGVTRDAAVNKLLALDRTRDRLPTGVIDLGITPIIRN